MRWFRIRKFMRDNPALVTGIVGLLAAVASWSAIIPASRQVAAAKHATFADFTFRLYDTFYLYRPNEEINRALASTHEDIECSQRYGKDPETGYSTIQIGRKNVLLYDLDKYIGYIELLNFYLRKQIMDRKTIEALFGPYIVLAYENSGIQCYIQTCEVDKGRECYPDFKEIAKLMKKSSNHP